MKIDGANINPGSQMNFDPSAVYSTLINYYADYSSNYTANSLIDKNYVDSKFSSGTWKADAICDDLSASVISDLRAMYQIYKGVDGGYDIMNFIIASGADGLNSETFNFTFEPPSGFTIRSFSNSTIGTIMISEQGISSSGDLYAYQNIDTMYVDSVDSAGWKIRANFDLTSGFQVPSTVFRFVISGTSEGTYTP
jgi:hypothetical protein